MVDQKDLTDWILNHREALKLEITETLWPEKYEIDLCDTRAQIKIEDKTYFGSGSDNIKDLAILKSFSEAVERFYLLKSKLKTSNGISCHINYDLAFQTSKNELLERDLFLCHFLTKTPFLPVSPPPEFSAKFLTSRLKSQFELEKIEIDFFTSNRKMKNVEFLVRAINGLNCIKPFGLIIGSAAKTEFNFQYGLHELFEKSFIEAMRQFDFHYNMNPIQTLSINEFSKLKVQTFNDHAKLGLSTDYANKIQFLFDRSFELTKKASMPKSLDVKEMNSNDLYFSETLKYSSENHDAGFLNLPLRVLGLECSELQNLFTGTTTIDKINLARLQQFSKNPQLSYLDLNQLPHFFC